MENKKFASSVELRQFFVTFLTAVIVLTCYHLVRTITDCLESSCSPKYNIIHCYLHNDDKSENEKEDQDEQEEKKPAATKSSGNDISSIARKI